MKNKTTHQINKETRIENLDALRRAIDNRTLLELPTPNNEWGGGYVIITSSEENLKNFRIDDVTVVITQHSMILSKLFHYVKENIMVGRDFYLYGFMALLANDFIRQFGDLNDFNPLLDYVVSGISFYCQCDVTEMFDMMRFFLSDNVTDEEINKIL